MIAAEQKARTGYDNLLRLIENPEVRDPLKFLREREIVHFQRFGEALRTVQDGLDPKNFYMINPAFDRKGPKSCSEPMPETDCGCSKPSRTETDCGCSGQDTSKPECTCKPIR